MNTNSRVASVLTGDPSIRMPCPTLPHVCDNKPPIVIVARASRMATCGTCREQLDANDYAKRMLQFERAAEAFWLKELGKPYVPFAGVGK